MTGMGFVAVAKLASSPKSENDVDEEKVRILQKRLSDLEQR